MAGFAAEQGEKKALLSSLLFLIVAFIMIVLFQRIGLVPARRLGDVWLSLQLASSAS